MLKIMGLSIASTSRVDDNEIVGGGGAGAENGGNICQQIY